MVALQKCSGASTKEYGLYPMREALYLIPTKIDKTFAFSLYHLQQFVLTGTFSSTVKGGKDWKSTAAAVVPQLTIKAAVYPYTKAPLLYIPAVLYSVP